MIDGRAIFRRHFLNWLIVSALQAPQNRVTYNLGDDCCLSASQVESWADAAARFAWRTILEERDAFRDYRSLY